MIDKYQVCKRCVLDTTAPKITFNEKGYCNYCERFLDKISNYNKSNNQYNIYSLITKIKKSGKNKKYDCILGLSGGLDSTWALKVIIENGLKPLAVHMDNGWNSELGQNNIHNIIEVLNVDLYTHVINWSEYKDMMNAFFESDVLDIEILMDQAFIGALYKQANKYGVKYILTGQNNSNEGMGMPDGWNWYKLDKKNIKRIYSKFGKHRKIKTYPFFGTVDFIISKYLKGIQKVRFLDYVEFNDKEAVNTLIENFNYKPYKYKHGESIFTKFYQGYILPKKFNIDKRRLHLSNKILTGQITRDEALKILQTDPYSNKDELNSDIEYVSKKLEWSDDYLSKYVNRPGVPHNIYGTEKYMLKKLLKVKKIINKILFNKKL